MTAPDPDLLAAFAPEFRAGAERLAGLTEAVAAARLLANLRAMVEAVGLPVLLPPLETAEAAVSEADLGALPAAARAMLAALDGMADPTAAAAGIPSAPAAPARRVRTLLVDDSPTMRRLMRQVLALDPAFEVVGEAADGAEALARCAELAPDLILLDIEMPGMDGIAMLRRWALSGPGTVVVVSAAAAPGSPIACEARRLGAAAVTGKPSGAVPTALLGVARRAAGLPPAAGTPA